MLKAMEKFAILIKRGFIPFDSIEVHFDRVFLLLEYDRTNERIAKFFVLIARKFAAGFPFFIGLKILYLSVLQYSCRHKNGKVM
jgi:hypothetical protein